jgi:hypothetical protein
VRESIFPDADEHLATGWETDVGVGDTLVRQSVHLHASWPTTMDLVPSTAPYFLSAWQGPDLTPDRLGRHGYPRLMLRFPAPHDAAERWPESLRPAS